MTIPFDDAAAHALISAARRVSTKLTEQGPGRRAAAEEAHEEFSGSYASLLTRCCQTEAEDRAKLAGTLEDLAAKTAEAQSRAEQERERVQALAGWRVREDQRARERAADTTGTLHADAALTDPMPSTYPIAPPAISASFSARQRTRQVGARDASGRSSADPVRLRSFVSKSQAMNTSLEAEVVALQNAWARFLSTCSWVKLGSVDFATGFARLVSENKADASWMERVAGRFERAGGVGVLNSSLNRSNRSTALDISREQKFKDLLDGKLSPEEAAEYWGSLGLTAREVRQLPPEALLKLASMSGLPAWAQDAASREFLDYAIDNPQQAYDMMGFTDPFEIDAYGQVVRTGTDISLAEFTKQMQGIKDELADAKEQGKRLNGGLGAPIQLIGLGSHDGVLVAGVSIGDLDTATNVGVNVSGMDSSVKDLGDGDRAAQELHSAAYDKNTVASYAVVNWIGYRSPGLGEVHSMSRAESGAERLVSFLNGINASRLENGTKPKQFNVYAHSYGSTTAAEALKKISFTVDRLVTYGSAGLKNDSTLDQLKADKVYATHAKGDNVARLGQHGEKKVDPLDIGAIRFSSEASVTTEQKELKRVTMHSMYSEKDQWSFANGWAGTVGYLSRDSTSLDRMSNLLIDGRATR